MVTVSVGIKGFRPVETIEFSGGAVVVEAVDVHGTGEPEVSGVGTGGDCHVAHFNGGVACIGGFIGCDLYNGQLSGECEVGNSGDTQVNTAYRVDGEAIESGIGE